MPSGVRDIQLLELKDTISQLNNTICTPTRAGSNSAAFLASADPGYYLMVDGYKGYNKVPEAQRCC